MNSQQTSARSRPNALADFKTLVASRCTKNVRLGAFQDGMMMLNPHPASKRGATLYFHPSPMIIISPSSMSQRSFSPLVADEDATANVVYHRQLMSLADSLACLLASYSCSLYAPLPVYLSHASVSFRPASDCLLTQMFKCISQSALPLASPTSVTHSKRVSSERVASAATNNKLARKVLQTRKQLSCCSEDYLSLFEEYFQL